MKRWQIAVLIFELALFAAILVMPQVALPDCTFHGGNAPVAAHSRVCQSTLVPVIAMNPQTLVPDRAVQRSNEHTVSISLPAHSSRLSRLCVLIC
jgi:hypothetical protein